MSLPIRHGPLFPSTQPPSKKFGKHCATIKYRLHLAPVFLAHTYTQHSWEDWSRGHTKVLGIKGRIGTFNVDMHQREQEERVYSEHLKTTRKTLHKAFFRVEIDCKDTELRVLSARFTDANKPNVDPGVDFENDTDTDSLGLDDAEPIPDEDLPWVDLDDYYDLFVILQDHNPSMRIIRCFRAPRLTYSRYSQPDANNHNFNGDAASETADERTTPSKFGNELTHTCFLNKAAGEPAYSAIRDIVLNYIS